MLGASGWWYRERLSKRVCPVSRSTRCMAEDRGRRDGLPSLRWLGRAAWLVLACWFVVPGVPVVRGQTPANTAVSPNLPFAISDFDGDLHPDVAVVQEGRSDRSLTDYWVQLRLSALGPQAIRVVAPAGGLQIDARDVNGDDVPDLVLTTAWQKQPVAILLNDGHGSFSRIDPNAYPQAFRGSKAGWSGAAAVEADLLGVPSQSYGIGCLLTGRARHTNVSVGAAQKFECGFVRGPDLAGHWGRDPPTEVDLL